MRTRLLTRRSMLGGCIAGLVGLAGCLGSEQADRDQVPAPVTIAGETCDVCGMIIGDHPGPAAQVYYQGGMLPEGRQGPAWFDSTVEAVAYHEQARSRGAKKLACYVVDYSRVPYKVFTHSGITHISSHPTAEAFVDAREVTFAADTKVQGAMGPDVIGFMDDTEAAAFVEEYGGVVLDFAEVFQKEGS